MNRRVSTRTDATRWRVAARAKRGNNSCLFATSVALAILGSASASTRTVASSSADASKACTGGDKGVSVDEVGSVVVFVADFVGVVNDESALTAQSSAPERALVLGERFFELAGFSLQVALEVLRVFVGALEVPL
jgi:hypothetical protein